MRRICLLQFHKEWDVCVNRLELLRAFNPNVPIYGLFGGVGLPPAILRTGDASGFADVFPLQGHDGRWLWQHTDLAVLEWFRARGHALSFDIAHVVQWDLLLLAPLSTLYREIRPGAVALTGLTPLDAIKERWHWTTDPQQSAELLQLREWVQQRYELPRVWRACLGPGYALPRRFLEAYAQLDVPELTHDELRLPLFAAILGFEVADTRFYRNWFDEAEDAVFNANGDEIDTLRIHTEISQPDGRRAFHPYRRIWPLGCANTDNGSAVSKIRPYSAETS